MIRFSKTSEDEKSTNKGPIQGPVSCPAGSRAEHVIPLHAWINE
jgi:hypothetical protein